eukprot:3413350-Alexandrium_andersonii.AAC.1
MAPKQGSAFIKRSRVDEAAAAIYGPHGHFMGVLDLEVEALQADVRRAQGNPRNGPRFGDRVIEVQWDDSE